MKKYKDSTIRLFAAGAYAKKDKDESLSALLDYEEKDEALRKILQDSKRDAKIKAEISAAKAKIDQNIEEEAQRRFEQVELRVDVLEHDDVYPVDDSIFQVPNSFYKGQPPVEKMRSQLMKCLGL